ncbi:Sec [Parasponia andersonii]|uniref:Sec n=1 Tax=Parasponia andersonii TaxID=3476 RepID=A0A2P5AUV1_PARAD|nr:Sec [Parasponia andersonii]
MDKVEEEVEKAKKEWDETFAKLVDQIKAIESYGKSTAEIEEKKKDSLPRMNGVAQDCLALLNSLQFKLDLLAPQLPTDDQVHSAKSLLESWTNRSQSLRLSLRNANLQAKANMRKAAQEERELLLGGGRESTIRRRNLQTKAGMTSAAESITESLRRTRQMMVQEVERTASTLMTTEESTGVLRKAESEYKGHRSLLMRTRNLLSTMQRQDVIDRVIIALGFFLFSCAVLYVVSKRIGLLKLQRTVSAALKSGMAQQAVNGRRAVVDGINQVQVHDNVVNILEIQGVDFDLPLKSQEDGKLDNDQSEQTDF